MALADAALAAARRIATIIDRRAVGKARHSRTLSPKRRTRDPRATGFLRSRSATANQHGRTRIYIRTCAVIVRPNPDNGRQRKQQEFPMDNINRFLFAIALIMTLVGSFALCAKAYDWARSEPRAMGARIP